MGPVEFLGGAPGTNTKPTIITQKRTGELLLGTGPAIAHTLTADFYKEPKLLAVDGDVPEMPAPFHRIIVCEAAIKYGNKEAAAEVITGMSDEYDYLLEKLQSSQLIGGEFDSQYSQDVPLVMDIPGFDDLESDGQRWRP